MTTSTTTTTRPTTADLRRWISTTGWLSDRDSDVWALFQDIQRQAAGFYFSVGLGHPAHHWDLYFRVLDAASDSIYAVDPAHYPALCRRIARDLVRAVPRAC